jgi:Ca2+-binding EF-hand superfamily protein
MDVSDLKRGLFQEGLKTVKFQGDDTMNKIRVCLVLVLFFIVASATAALCGQSYPQKEDDNKGGGMALNAHLSDLDTDGDDTLNFKEFKSAFPSTEQKAFDFLDSDKDGMLNHDEWDRFKEMHKGMGMHHKKNFHAASLPDPSGFNAHFPDMDTDKNGLITPMEFNAYFPEASETTKVFNAIDLDESGALDHDEWHEFKKAHDMKHVE